MVQAAEPFHLLILFMSGNVTWPCIIILPGICGNKSLINISHKEEKATARCKHNGIEKNRRYMEIYHLPHTPFVSTSSYIVNCKICHSLQIVGQMYEGKVLVINLEMFVLTYWWGPPECTPSLDYEARPSNMGTRCRINSAFGSSEEPTFMSFLFCECWRIQPLNWDKAMGFSHQEVTAKKKDHLFAL